MALYEARLRKDVDIFHTVGLPCAIQAQVRVNEFEFT